MGLVKAACYCVCKSVLIMQLILLDLCDKSQCAVAAGLFWQPRWLGFLLHFHKMSSGHGSVRCLPLFFFLFYIFTDAALCCLLNVVQTLQKRRELWQKATEQLFLTWTEDRWDLSCLQSSSLLTCHLSRHVQTKSLFHHCQSVWCTLFLYRIGSNTFHCLTFQVN